MYKPEGIACLYIDFDAFFANVEKQLDPAIRNNPVGITSLQSENATLITCCYQAKRVGVKRGMRVFEAKALCGDLVIRPARHDVYVKMHNKIVEVVGQYVPVTRTWSIDEVECTLIGREKREALALAENIREGLAEQIGPAITPSIGLAANQFLAKVAAEMNKPNGFTILHPDDLPRAIKGLSLQDLPGISSGMQSRLNKAGVVSIDDFWNISAKHARSIWGSVEGERMWAQLRGYAVSRPETQRRMFGHSRLLSGNWQHPQKAKDCLRLLTVKAAYRMRREGFTAGSMAISVKNTKSGRVGRQTGFAACSDDHSLAGHMERLYGQIIHALGTRARIQSVSVTLFDIVPVGQRTGDMFEDSTAHAGTRKWDALTATMDSLNEKHGACVVHLGPRAVLPGGYAGAKIAFGRVPDAGDFF
ncbi:MAG: Y-family DNA polymerase [Alphaproteobacteria bacterium]